MNKSEKPAGQSLAGKISDFIRSGKLPKDTHVVGKRPESGADMPTTKAIKSAKGQGLGKGATRKRNGGAS